MSNQVTRPVRQPRYLQDFVCAADKCIDNCCTRWQIDLDKKTYERYTRHVTNRVLKPLIANHVHRDPQNTDPARYGHIELKADQSCPFLTIGKLCRIQKTLGADALSFICRHYPRSQTVVAGRLEQHAAMSCPEIARKILADPQALDFSERELPADDILPLSTAIGGGDHAGMLGFYALRDAAIALVDAHAPHTEIGMFAVVMLAQSVDERVAAPGGIDGPGFPAWLTERVEILASASFAENFARVSVDPSIPMRLLKEIVVERLAGPGGQQTGPRYIRTILECLRGLDYSDDDRDGSLRGYRAATAGFRDFVGAQPWVMRNIAVYDVTKNTLFAPGKPAMKQVLGLTIRYVYLRFLLTGLHALWKETFDLDRCVNAAYAFSRAIEHSPTFMTRIATLLEEQQLHGAAGMAMMLKG